MNDLTQSDVVSLLFYGVIALYVAQAIPRMFRGRFTAGVAALTFWVAAFVAVITGYAYRTELSGVASRVMATVVPGTPLQTGSRQVTVMRATDGEFIVRGTAGKTRLQFILDTGASTVVLKSEDATRLGIDTRRLTYDMDVMTANGHALTAAARIPQLAIGDVVEHDVDVLVARPGLLHENLLGMSFLNRLASFTVADDKLVLTGR